MGICQGSTHSQSHTEQLQSQTLNSAKSLSSPSNMSTSKIPTKNDSGSIIKRLLIILSEYYKLNIKNEAMSSINWSDLFGSSSNYSDENLVNDFNYILDNFNDDEDLEKIHNQLLQKINDKDNSVNNYAKGSILYRHLICDKWEYNSKKSISNLYFNCKDTNDIIKYKLLDKMFSHFMYAHMLGLRLTFNEIQSIDIAAAANEEKDKNEQDLDLGLAKLNEIISKKREKWNELKSKEWMNKYANDKFVTFLNRQQSIDEDSKNAYEQQLEEDERNKDNKEKKNIGKHMQRRASQCNEYEIGNRYYYSEWNYYSENSEKLKIRNDLIIRRSHFSNLKSEMIDGEAMSIDQWYLCEMYCKLLFNTRKCKKLKCDILKSDGHGIDIHYGYKQGDPIQLQHILCIFIYCNFPNIKRSLHRHLSDNKYSNFGRLLREIVEGFGISVFSDDSENEFYHNVHMANNNNNFNGYLALKFCSPTLMTHMSNVIHLYNFEHKYATLNLCKYTNASSVNYFQCNWISDNSLDSECVFIGGKYALKIKSIIIHNFYNYSHYLNAIHILASLIKGKANTLAIDKKILFAIETLTKNKLQPKEDKNCNEITHDHEMKHNENRSENGNDYMMKIFNKFCSNITTPIYINLIWILDNSSNGYNAIKQWITNENNSWIRFDVLCCLFPNVEKVKIGHSQFNLMDNTFDEFTAFFGGNINKNKNSENDENNMKQKPFKYKLKEITIEDPDENNVSVKTIISKYQHQLNEIGWKMESNKYYTKIFLTRKTQDNLWDDLF